ILIGDISRLAGHANTVVTDPTTGNRSARSPRRAQRTRSSHSPNRARSQPVRYPRPAAVINRGAFWLFRAGGQVWDRTAGLRFSAGRRLRSMLARSYSPLAWLVAPAVVSG